MKNFIKTLFGRSRAIQPNKFSFRPSPRQDASSSEKSTEIPVGPEEAAKFLRMSRSTVLALAREGVIPAHPVTNGRRKRWLFFISELAAYVRGLGVNCGSHPCAS
jgi:excisionase family DNA binding protein